MAESKKASGAAKDAANTAKDAASSASGGAKAAVSKYGMASIGLAIGGALMILGSFMDWASVGNIGANGIGDSLGELTLISGVVLLLIGIAPFVEQLRGKVADQAAHIAGAAALVLTAWTLGSEGGDIREASEEADAAIEAAQAGAGEFGGFVSSFATSFKPEIEIGFWIVLIGGIVAGLGLGLYKLGKHVDDIDDVKNMSMAHKKMALLPAAAFIVIFALFFWVF